MRCAALVGVMALAGCVGGAPEIVAQTPGSIEIKCIGALVPQCASPQAVADVAEAHCAKYGQVAQQTQLRQSQSGNREVTFACVAPGPKAAR